MMITKRKSGLPVMTAVLFFSLAMSVAAGAAWGQTAPNAGSLLKQTQKTVPWRKTEKPSATAPVRRERPMKKPPEAKLYVKGFTFSMDFPVVPVSELQKIVKNYEGREVTFGELDEAAGKITRFLRDKGYFLARAYIPQQKIVGGIVRIDIIVGRAEAGKGDKVVEVEGEHKRLHASVVQNIMGDSIKTGEPLKLAELERGILLVNDLPGVTAKADLSAGNAPGTTEIKIKENEGPLVTGLAGLDNFGNRYTGRERSLANFNINDLTGYGDQITLSGIDAGDPVFATNNGNMWLWQAGWQAPIGYTGLRAGLDYSSLGYRVGQEFSDLDLHGSARTWTLNAIYPMIRGRKYSLYGSMVFMHRNLFDATALAVSDNKRVNEATLGLQGDAVDTLFGGGYMAYGLGVTYGDLGLGDDPDDLATDRQTANTDGHFWKLDLNAMRLQNIGKGFSLYLAASGQYADKNLDSSEQFILGGPTGMRAYPVGEASGDDGLLGNVELRKDLPGAVPVIGHIQVRAFYDYGWIRLHKAAWTGWNAGDPGLDNSYVLSDAGAGINIGMAGKYLFKAFWAAKIGSNPGESAQGFDSDGQKLSSRLWFQGLYYF